MMRPLPPPVNLSGPPPIPAARTAPLRHHGHLLIWVRTGLARVLVDDGAEFRLTKGEALWIPAANPNPCVVMTDPGTVAFPLWLHASVSDKELVDPIRLHVAESWQDWLIQHYNLQVTPLAGRGYSQDAVADLLRRPDSRPSGPGREAEPELAALLDPPTMPKAAGASAVAEELMRDPALQLTVKEWSVRVSSSPRTLLRDFLADTHLTFEQWRLRNRMASAVEFLAAGYGVDQVAARVGFASRGGFRRAFHQQFGRTPYEVARELATRPVTGEQTGLAAAARQADDLALLAQAGGTSGTAPDLLPPASTPPHTNDSHVLSWMYRGSGYLDVGDQRYERQRGVATWIPAGAEHVTGLRRDSISLPLGNATTAELQLSEPLQVQFSPAWDDYLMFCSISARSALRPDDYDRRRVIDLFAEQLTAQRALSVPMPTDPRARAAALDYLRRIGVRGGSVAFDIPAEVHRAFREETGMTFARWRYAARMRIARDLLAADAKPSAVACRLGYGHLPNFSAAFTRFHGISPRDYQERET